MRYAIYYTPPEGSPLARTGAAWLGRDAFSGRPVPHPVDAFLPAETVGRLTTAARRYGFHATLKAPFRLEEGRSEAELIAALDQFAASVTLFPVDLEIDRIRGFFALTSKGESKALDGLAANVVAAFEPFRAPLSEADIARRSPDRLTPEELENLHRWGYPYVFNAFRFHMTLTGRIEPAESAPVEASLRRLFKPQLREPLIFGSLALFTEKEDGAPFLVRSLHPFGRRA
jgi:putative phosphonate metabolism protein